MSMKRTTFWRPPPCLAGTVFCAVLICLLASAASHAADVRLVTGPYLRVGQFAAIEVQNAGPGQHVLRDEQILPVSWEGPGAIVLPVLIVGPVSGQLRLEVNGDPVTLSVEPLAMQERLLLDGAGTLTASELARLAQAVFPQEVVRISPAPAAGAAVAYEAADAILLDRPPDEPQVQAWLAAGVSVVVLQRPQGAGWEELTATGAWIRRPLVAPLPGPVEPDVYAASLAWRPGRPAAERWGVIAGLCGLILLTAGLVVTLRTGQRQAIALLAICGVAVLAAIAWVQVRPDVAVREARFRLLQDGRPPLHDRWLFLAAPESTEPVEARIAFVGTTRPIAYDRAHLRELAPVLVCDADGTPRHWRLRLPPRFTAAVLQRSAGDSADPPRLEPWAQPLADQWYRRRGAIEQDGAVIRIGR